VVDVDINYLNIGVNNQYIKNRPSIYNSATINRMNGFRLGVLLNRELNDDNYLKGGLYYALRTTRLEMKNGWYTGDNYIKTTRMKTIEMPFLFRKKLFTAKGISVLAEAGLNSCLVISSAENYDFQAVGNFSRYMVEKSFGWDNCDFAGQLNIGASRKKFSFNLGYNRTLFSGSGGLILPQNFYSLGLSYTIFEYSIKSKGLNSRRIKEIKNY
jgi:hypothetical protein